MSEKLPITGLSTTGLPDAVIVCGDPERAAQVADYIEGASLFSRHREYTCFVGAFRQMPVAACSHGIGAPGAAIAFEELIRAGARRIVRVGTCGALQPGVAPGHLVIAQAAMQNTGYGREVAPDGYPAVADPALTLALMQSTRSAGRDCSCGVVLTRDAFYQGVGASVGLDYKQMAEANVLAVEMECAALFLVGGLRRIQTGAILAVDGNVLDGDGEDMDTYQPDQPAVRSAVQAEIQIALTALRLVYDEPG